MAHPYTTRVRLDAHVIGSSLAIALLDHNRDGAEDNGAWTAVAERAANKIDARLRGKYSVPFAAITDSTPCDGTISDICDDLIVGLLYASFNPDSGDSKYWLKKVDDALELIRIGTDVISGTPVAAAAATIGMSSFGQENTYGLDSTGRDRADRY